MWLKEKMSTWRHQKIKQVLAIFALVAMIVHAGVTPSHFIMRAAPVAPQTLVTADADLAAKAWAFEIGALICHGSGASDDGAPSNGKTPLSATQSCPICTAVHSVVAVNNPSAFSLHAGWSRPITIGIASQSAVTQVDAHAFEARGPPTAA